MQLLNKIWKSKFWLPVTILTLIGLNWLASQFHTRLDFTNEKRFTLSSPTKKIVKKLDDVVQIDVFLKGEFPSGFKKLANSTSEILHEFKEVGGKKIQYNFISPDDVVEGTDVKWGDTLSANGLYPINLKSQLKAGEQQQLVYPVALVHYKQNVLPVNLYTGNKTFITAAELNSAEALMEFKFADAIYKASQTTKPMLAYAVGHGEPQDIRTYDLAENVLKQDYNLQQFNLTKLPVIPDTFKLLLLVKPTEKFTDEEKLKIDQFVMRGGKVLMFIDRLNAEMDSLRIKNEVIAYDRGLELNDLLFKYGARVNPDLVLDLQCDFLPFDVNGKGQFEFLHWNYFPLFESKSNHVINKNLGLVSGKFVNSVDTLEVEGIKKTILLSSSSNSKTIATPALISGKENVNEPENDKFKKANIPVAVLLEGKFTSMFKNRLSQAMNDSLANYGAMFMQECIANNKIIVVADGDMVLNSISKNEPLPMGVNPLTVGSQYQYQFANKDFLQNCLDYLLNSSGLAEAKAKDYTLRLLDTKKVESQKIIWQLITIALPIVLVILFALLFQWLHKRKFTV
ncbi:MAG: gliding motility-associated ABC transporter substrate-binding protein GldG [Chitinophagaceae bacterium]|nr:gliding motility-associated ABC transporter substrate-binding protein GldG [Chitinophagaceae bacterium]